MSVTPASARVRLGWLFNVAVCAAGVVLAAIAIATAVSDTTTAPLLICVGGVALTVVVARFPIVFDRGDGDGVEAGFDSTVLVFMLCTLETTDALVVWSLGVVATQLIADKRPAAKVFNIGVGIIAGTVAAVILSFAEPRGVATAQELALVALAATAYFATDLLLSAVSLTISSGVRFTRHLLQRRTLLAIACFVPFDMLGYLAAIVHRAGPWWTLSLLGVPLATLLIATRAITRGEENARRLSALFDAAVRAQTLATRTEVEEALVEDARRLLRLTQVAVRPTPPGRSEIGAQVHGGDTPTWVVAKALDRARSTSYADEQALLALAAVAAEALSRLELTDEMVHVARHDPLTDLPNRGIMLDRVTQALRAAHSPERPVALLFIDLDGFKPVNDRFGHEAGDAVLVELASRLRSCVGDAGTVARLGGDEFAVLFENRRPLEVEVICDQLLIAIKEDVTVNGQAMSVGASAGIAFGHPTDTATGLVRKADLAMYASKVAAKGQVEEYDDAMGRSRLERLELVDDLRHAIARGRIEVAYQPIIDVETGRILGAEALARWTRDGVAVAPEVFIPAAEDAGLIVDLGAHVLATVASDAAALRRAVDGSFLLTVNVSARQLREPTFVDSVRQAVTAMEGLTLVLEITERQGIDLDPSVLARMEAIRAAGAELAIDDFGVGFSSISYLHDLPVQYLKADASLAQDIDTDERARALLRSVIAMGRTLGLSLVVEGIESEAQLVALGDDTADLSAQGYLMYRPMPAVRLVDVVAADAHALQATGIGGGAATGRVSRVDRWQEVAAAVGMSA
jgi:diguanylate cyclase (GGDEF)-like protein